MIKIKLSGEDYGILVHHFEQTPLTMQKGEIKALIELLMMDITEKFHSKSFYPRKVISMTLKPAQAIALKQYLTHSERPSNPYTLSLVITLTETIYKQLTTNIQLWAQMWHN